MNPTFCPPCGPGLIPSHGGVFQEVFPRLITLCQPVLSQRGRQWLDLPSMTPHNLWRHRGGRLKCNHGQKMAEKIYQLKDDQVPE